MIPLLSVFAAAPGAAFDRACELKIAGGKVVPIFAWPTHLADLRDLPKVSARVDWDRLVGREVLIEFRSKTEVRRTSRQWLLDRGELLRRFPVLREPVESISQATAEGRSAWAKWGRLKFMRHVPYLGPRFELLDLFYPGEFAVLVASHAGRAWTSPLVRGFQKSISLRHRLASVHCNAERDALKDELERVVDRSHAGPRPTVEVFFVHNHPGPWTAPLSNPDVKDQRRTAELLDLYKEHFDYRLTYVALSTLHETGDVAFVRTVDARGEVRGAL